MSQNGESGNSANGHVFKVDKFVVPEEAREEFVAAIRNVHGLLREQPGFVRDYLLEKSGGPGEFNIVTMVEWQSDGTIDDARTAVSAMHERTGFNPQDFIAHRGIRVDIANYRVMDL